MPRDYKPLPTLRKLDYRLLSVLVDANIGTGSGTGMSEAQLADLSRRIDLEFGLACGASLPLCMSMLGVPDSNGVVQVLRLQLSRWLPALRAGYKFGSGEAAKAAVPHTIQVSEPLFDPDSGRWQLGASFTDGPLQGTVSDLLVSQQMACRMLANAIGVRAAYSLSRPRPYDLHGMVVLATPKQLPQTVGIDHLLPSAAIVRRNQVWKARLGKCQAGRFETGCFDCGAGERDCPMARHRQRLRKAACHYCGHTRVSTEKGICIVCLDNMMKYGMPPATVRAS